MTAQGAVPVRSELCLLNVAFTGRRAQCPEPRLLLHTELVPHFLLIRARWCTETFESVGKKFMETRRHLTSDLGFRSEDPVAEGGSHER